jgi:hypothetical protein
MEMFEKQMFPFAETGGSPVEIPQFSLQIPMMEKCEKQMFIYTEIGGSPQEILWFSLHSPKMRKFGENAFLAEMGGSPEEIPQFSLQIPIDGEVLSINVSFYRDWRQPGRNPPVRFTNA